MNSYSQDQYGFLGDDANVIKVCRKSNVVTLYIDHGGSATYTAGTALFNYLPEKYRPPFNVLFSTSSGDLSVHGGQYGSIWIYPNGSVTAASDSWAGYAGSVSYVVNN